MDNYSFTLLLKGNIKAYSPGQITDHLGGWETERELRAILCPGERADVSIDLLRGVIDSENMPKYLEFASTHHLERLKWLREKIAISFYEDYLKLLSAHIHNMGHQIVLLRSVRDGFWSRPYGCVQRADTLTGEINEFEEHLGFKNNMSARRWESYSEYRDYNNYIFKARPFGDLLPGDQKRFWDSANFVLSRFIEIFSLAELEEFVQERGIILSKKEDQDAQT